MNDILSLYPKPEPLSKFTLIGFLPSPLFQKCRYLIQKISSSFPKIYNTPEIRGLLNADWDEYLTKMRRLHGKPFYLIQSPVAIFYNGELLGDDKALMAFISEKYSMEITLDFEEIAEKELIQYFSQITEESGRKFVFLTFAIDEHVVGSMLFMLYNDLVPKTCENFLKRCQNKTVNFGYKGTRVHSIAKYSWIQCGGYSLDPIQMSCENYAIPHNRRGVISMCNQKRHSENSTQFFITLDSTPWMDHNYVAFGQLVQGIEILSLIEKIPTFHQKPTRIIKIVNSGEFSLCPETGRDYKQALNPPYESLFVDDQKDDDIVSILSRTGFKAGKYFLKTDLRSYLPFTRYSKLFESYFKNLDEDLEMDEDKLNCIEEDEEENETDDARRNALFQKSGNFYYTRKKSTVSGRIALLK